MYIQLTNVHCEAVCSLNQLLQYVEAKVWIFNSQGCLKKISV